MDVRDSIISTLRRESEVISALIDSVEEKQIEEVIRAFMECTGKIILSGCGTSGAAAQKIEHTLSCVGCPSFFLSPSNALHGGMGVIRENDIVLLLSKSGYTTEINSMIKPCRKRGALLVAVTENENSELAQTCDLLLKIKTGEEPDDHNILATGSIVATIAVFDAIAIAITRLRGFSEAEFLTIHPGGGVGKRLAENRK